MARLGLVYHPVSNQEVEWVREVDDVEALLRRSDLYIIAARPEVFFTAVELGDDEIHVALAMGEDFSGEAVLSAPVPPGYDNYGGDVNFDIGPKIIKFLSVSENGDDGEILQWFTADKLLMDRAHGMPGVTGLDNYRDAMVFDLLYVGIAKVGDSFDRVVANGHAARQRILSNEDQRGPGARVTDEVYIFFFDHAAWILSDEGADASGAPDGYSAKRVIADAEKALVSLLKPPYNSVLFASYPKGKDGLYNLGFDYYEYFIGEAITFRTATSSLSGGEPRGEGIVGADIISVRGETLVFDKAE